MSEGFVSSAKETASTKASWMWWIGLRRGFYWSAGKLKEERLLLANVEKS